MADRIVTILTPATSFDLMTLDECKMMLGLSVTDTSDDAQLQLFIDINSATIARICNRTFAYEEVREEWRELNGGNRVYLSHWPVAPTDVESVEAPIGTVLDPSTYELEPMSGKIEVFNGAGFVEPVAVQYWGGYELPDDAPLPLKRALALLNLQSRLLASLGTIAGIRQLGHKEARISYHDPSKILAAAMGGGAAGTNPLMQILDHYIRHEV